VGFYRRYTSTAFMQSKSIRVPYQVYLKLFLGKSLKGGFILNQVGPQFASEPYVPGKVVNWDVEGLVKFGEERLSFFSLTMHTKKHFDLVFDRKLLNVNAHFLGVPRRVIWKLNEFQNSLNNIETRNFVWVNSSDM
jgi:hypothetical protein